MREPLVPSFTQVRSLDLFAAMYLVILGVTYAVRPVAPIGLPGTLQWRGLVYVTVGVLLLWTAIEVLRAQWRAAVMVGAAVVVLSSSADMLSRALYGAGAAHALLGLTLLVQLGDGPRHAEQRGMSLLGLVLGGTQLLVGVNGLVDASALPAAAFVPARMVAALYAVSGAAVVLVSVRPARPDHRRLSHQAAGIIMLSAHVLMSVTTMPLFFVSGVASWLRAVVTLALPRWESEVGRLNAHTLRARFAVSCASMTLLTGVMILTLLPLDGAGAVIEWHRLGALWVVLLATLAAAWAGSASADHLTALLRGMVKPQDTLSRPVLPAAPAELREIAEAVHLHVEQAARLEAQISERDVRVSAVGHDLRSPLGVIVNASTVLQQAPDDPALVRRMATAIHRQSEAMQQMLENMVESARLSAGAVLPLPAHAVPLQPWLEELLAHHPLAVERVRLLPSNVVALADPGSLRRIVLNLIDNALKYSRDLVELRVERVDGEAWLRVQDHGRGIPAAEHEAVFTRFYRANGAAHESGFGLGLYIARKLAEAGGGRLWVTDTPGGGATFVLALPLAGVAAPPTAGVRPDIAAPAVYADAHDART